MAGRLVSFSLYTDACLLFPPSQIAIVALKIAGASKKCEIKYVHGITEEIFYLRWWWGSFFNAAQLDAGFVDSFQKTEESIKNHLKLGMTKKKIDEKAVRTLFEKLSSFYIQWVYS